MRKSHRLLLYGLLVVTIVLVGLAYWYIYLRVEEHFEGGMQLKADCPVYYTSRVEACDNPGTITENGIVIDYRFHRKHYEALRDELIAKNETSTDKYLTVLDILQDYDDFPDGQSCKVTPPGWQQIIGADESALLGDKHVGQRGNISQWAFCMTPDTGDTEFYARTGLQYETLQDGTYSTVDYNGQKYVRGAFPNFSSNVVTQMYCQSSTTPSAPQFTGLRVDPFTKEIAFMQDINTAVPITEDIVNQLMRNGLCGEATQDAGDNQELLLVAKSQSLQVLKLDKDLCNRVIVSPVQASMAISFILPIAPVKTVSLTAPSTQHLLGTTVEMESTQNQLMEQKRTLLNTLLTLNPTNTTRKAVYEYVTARITTLNNEIKNLRKKINRLNNTNKKLGAMAAGAAAGAPVGAIAAIGALIGTAIIRRKVARLNRRIHNRKKELYWLETDFTKVDCDNPSGWVAGLFGFKRKRMESKKRGKRRAKRKESYISLCKANKTNTSTANLCSPSNSTCPSNKPIMSILYNETKPFEEQVIVIDEKMKKIGEEVERIRSSYVDVTQTALNTRGIIIQNPPFHALSYDRKFYIMLS